MSDPVREIADAVLYEGYVLWPYRRSALKNQQRWTFGCVFPRRWNEAHPDDAQELRAAGLVECRDGVDRVRVDVRARFLHVVRRQALDQDEEPVDETISGGARYLSWEEATEREVTPGAFRIPGGSDREELESGALLRSWKGLEGRLEVVVEPVACGLAQVTARIANTAPWEGASRTDALARSFCSTHLVLRVTGGDFVSPLDPRARECRSEGLWPVLVGAPPERSTLLASPIILEDYPRVAPESPGDLFDGAEIDQLLTLSILGLTDEEKEEMRASDPRTRRILERTEAMTAEDLMRLHGTIRELRVPGRQEGEDLGGGAWTDGSRSGAKPPAR